MFEDNIPKPANHTRRTLKQVVSKNAPEDFLRITPVLGDFTITALSDVIREFSLEASGTVSITEYTTYDDGNEEPSSISPTEGFVFFYSMAFIATAGSAALLVVTSLEYNKWKRKYVLRYGKAHFGEVVWASKILRKNARNSVTLFFFIEVSYYTNCVTHC
jgi:hypothetical protein